jgi:protein-tyrosine phosphatase
MATILLVCTGNICRSPMAEGFLRRMLADRGIQGIRVESSGVAGWEGSTPTPEAVEALAGYGLDISTHRARRLTRPMVEWADAIVTMAAEHRDAVVRLVPQLASRVFTLKELVALLESVPEERIGRPSAEQLAASMRLAQAEREAHAGMELADQDIADPLGLGIESFRAVAWEIEDLSRRLVDGLFPGTGGAPVGSDESDGVMRTRSQEGGA